MSIDLMEELLGYSADDLKRWTTRDFTIIDKRLPAHVRNMLIEKICNRKSNPETMRFFSEVNILNHHAPMIKDGIVWYSSYKWLTKNRWLTGEVEEGYKSQFFVDLIKYIGRNNIVNLQKRANAFRDKDGGRILGLTKGGKVRYPVAPDIWLGLKDGGLKFIEGKHKEVLAGTQLVGLALIKKYLDCSISIMRVYPQNDPLPIQTDYSDSFSAIYNMV
ncbi:MAG: hypothetical protein WCJ37_03430 [Syntrophus sp. (in: bacteria)]